MPDVSDSPIAPTSMVLEIFTLIKRSVLAETHLPEDAAELVAFWTISTWFLDALTVLPCLVITDLHTTRWTFYTPFRTSA
jgi:hypothetical protein